MFLRQYVLLPWEKSTLDGSVLWRTACLRGFDAPLLLIAPSMLGFAVELGCSLGARGLCDRKREGRDESVQY